METYKYTRIAQSHPFSPSSWFAIHLNAKFHTVKGLCLLVKVECGFNDKYFTVITMIRESPE